MEQRGKCPADGFLPRIRRRIPRRNVKIKIFVGRCIRTSGMKWLQPATRILRQSETGQFGLDNANSVVGSGKTIVKSNTFIARRQFNYHGGAARIVERQVTEIQKMIYPRLDAGE